MRQMTVGWGFLGAGRIARHLVWVVAATPGAEVVAVGASSADRAGELGVGRAGSYDSVLDDPAVDVVYVALANHLHRRWVLRALAAGKAVLCEKPLGLSQREVREMAGAGGLLVEALMWRWHPQTRLVESLLPRIGPVEQVSAGFRFPGVAAGDYRLDPALGGGASLDVGVYPVSAALWAAGPVRSVSARSRGPRVDLATDYLLEHASGASSQLSASMDDQARQWLVVTGARGELEVRGDAFTGDGTVLFSDGRGTERLSAPGSGYGAMVAAVSARVRGGEDWVLPLADSLATAGVLDAARRSAAVDAPVDLG